MPRPEHEPECDFPPYPARDEAPDRAMPPVGSAQTPPLRPGAIVDWMFRSRETGEITIAQFPNVALWVFLVTVLLRSVVQTRGGVRTGIDAVAVAALAAWAVDEVVRGVNPWRRLLGVGGCTFAVVGAVSLLR